MSRFILLVALLTAAGCGTPAPASNGATPASTVAADATYACPMHPDVTSNAPGECPKCGMTMVKSEDHDHGAHEHGAADKPKMEGGHGDGHGEGH